MSTKQMNFIVEKTFFDYFKEKFPSKHQYTCYWLCCECNYCRKHMKWCKRKTIGDWLNYLENVWIERNAWLPSWLTR